ncbi:hypothetical protein LUZ62_060866 [Rhynchospora pubera]|uniref:Neprosin PEP catalytic domain-containing protein n=1 Tax=Rhynchospora pubera TaxID=906938 RepID=A0AAV8E7S6_9POAL|nr:hypothetical protein LUZ62_060866 [Rhynchospora pubera]
MAFKSILVLLFWLCNIAASLAGQITHHAGYVTYNGDYYGGQARTSAWGVPYMNPNSRYEVSLTLVSFNGRPDGSLKSFARVGLHVFPWLYHDTKLRFFTSWRDGNSHTGCPNTNCPGFVVSNSSIIYPGQAVSPLSQYDGEDRYMTFSIRKDPATQLWTVYREDYNTSMKIGWWQKGILGGLEDKADAVQWIGFVSYLDSDTGPSMGSGHFPREGWHKAAYMADLKYFDQAGNVYIPSIYDLAMDVDRPDCYAVLPAAAFFREIGDRNKFYYGGPRGCKN